MKSSKSKCVLVVFAVGMVCLPVSSLTAQRQDLVERADFSDAPTAISLYAQALDFDLGPVDGPWAHALTAMSALLRDVGDQATADRWLRWAMRHHRSFLDYEDPGWPETVVNAFPRIQADVGDAEQLDGITEWAWSWPGGALGNDGRFRINRRTVPDNVLVEVTGIGQVVGEVVLDPGSYIILVSSGDSVISRYDREILSGLVTTIHLDLSAEVLEQLATVTEAAGPGGAATGAQLSAAGAGGGFPVIAVLGILGAAGGAAAYFVLGGSGGGGQVTPPPTGAGGIIITYPIP